MNVTSTGLLYQPFASGGRVGPPVTVGGLPSYLIVIEREALLPALSLQVPVTVAPPLSGPPYVPPPVQDATPEAPSSPETPTSTGFVYHPLESGSRAGETLTPGGEESFLTVTLLPTNDPP